MSFTENYIELKKTIAKNEQDTDELYNLFAKNLGELGVAMSTSKNCELTPSESKLLSMAFDTNAAAKDLIINLRTEIFNKNVLISGMDETFGESLELMIRQDEKITTDKEHKRKGGKFAPWRVHEEVIISVLDIYDSNENRSKLSKDPTKLTQKRAIAKIEKETNRTLTASTFNSWLEKYRENNGKVFS